MIITVDTNTLVALFDEKSFDYGFKKFCQSNNVQQVLIPTPVLCEFLSHDSAQRFQFMQARKRIASLVNFDEKAAYMTAKIAEAYYKDRLPISRQKVKVDLQILGVAISNNSQFILTKDDDFSSYINHLDLPIGVKTIADLQMIDDMFQD